jgi:hypothetical protein
MMSQATIEQKSDYLRHLNSNRSEAATITDEMERMVQHSKQPECYAHFAALGNDPLSSQVSGRASINRQLIAICRQHQTGRLGSCEPPKRKRRRGSGD